MLKMLKRTVYCLSLLFLISPAVYSAETKNPSSNSTTANTVSAPATKLEEFLSKKGTLMVKSFYPLGNVTGRDNYIYSSSQYKGIILYTPGKEDYKIKGIRIQIQDGGKYSYDNPKSVFLDLEEAESLVNAIDYMIKLLAEWEGVKKEYTEIIFSTKGDFSIGFYQNTTEKGIVEQVCFVSAGSIGKAQSFLKTTDDLKLIRHLISKGLEILKDK